MTRLGGAQLRTVLKPFSLLFILMGKAHSPGMENVGRAGQSYVDVKDDKDLPIFH